MKPHCNPLKMGDEDYAKNYTRKLAAYEATQQPSFIENELNTLIEDGVDYVYLNGWREKTKNVFLLIFSCRSIKCNSDISSYTKINNAKNNAKNKHTTTNKGIVNPNYT